MNIRLTVGSKAKVKTRQISKNTSGKSTTGKSAASNKFILFIPRCILNDMTKTPQELSD